MALNIVYIGSYRFNFYFFYNQIALPRSDFFYQHPMLKKSSERGVSGMWSGKNLQIILLRKKGFDTLNSL